MDAAEKVGPDSTFFIHLTALHAFHAHLESVSWFPVPANLDWIEGVKAILDTIGPELLSNPPQRKAPDTERGPTVPSIAVN